MYSKVKSSIEAFKLERRQTQKQELVVNPEAAAERKKEFTVKKNKAANSKLKNGRKSQNIGKKILKPN